jgi:hypothetical protein
MSAGDVPSIRRTMAALQQAVSFELIEGAPDRIARHAVFRREVALGRQPPCAGPFSRLQTLAKFFGDSIGVPAHTSLF